VITLVVKIAAHGTRGDERFYGELDNVRLHFKCDRDLEEPRVRQQRIEIACEPFSIRAIVSSGDECGS
jgi:hypothetical protein